MENSKLFLSVIVPIYNEEKYIARCLDSILEQDYPRHKMEVLLVDGMSTDKTRDIVAGYSSCYPFIRLLDNPQKIVPYAMNVGIEVSRGNVIIRLDAHALYEKNYFSALVRRLVELGADNVGTVCRTDVLNVNAKTLAIRQVLSHRFGVGNSTFRLGITEVQEVDTVPFGCWRRDVFDKYGLYDVRLIRNQDIELNKRIVRGGGHIYIIPDTFCTYLARETFFALARNNYGNGKWNILTVFYTKQFSSLSIRHFIPLLFILSVILPLIGGLLVWQFALVGVFSLLLYTSFFCVISLQLAYKKHLSFIRLMQSFFVLHWSYGWGSLCGLLRLPFRR